MHAVVSIPLLPGEAEAFFGPGRRFAIWADAIVGDTTRGEGLVGNGVVCGQAPPSSPGDAWRQAHQLPGHRAPARGPLRYGAAAPPPRLPAGASPAGRRR